MPKMTRSHYDRVTAALVAFRDRHDLPQGLATDLFNTMADALEGTSETYKRDRFLANCEAGGWTHRFMRNATGEGTKPSPAAPAWEPRFMGRFIERRRSA